MDSERREFGTIENCSLAISLRCPMRWEALDPTANPRVRGCPVCLRYVHKCESEAELRQCVAEGKCVAVMWLTEDFDNGFVGVIVEDER